jgi:hypothetical protein
MSATIQIPTNVEYWLKATSPLQAQDSADALQKVLKLAAKLLGIEAYISQSPHSNGLLEDIDNIDQQTINSIVATIWQDDQIQYAAFHEPIDAWKMLRDYDAQCVRHGGTGYPQFRTNAKSAARDADATKEEK